MKKIILNSFTVCTLFFASAVNAQVGIGVPAENIHPSAELEVKRVFASTYDYGRT